MATTSGSLSKPHPIGGIHNWADKIQGNTPKLHLISLQPGRLPTTTTTMRNHHIHSHNQQCMPDQHNTMMTSAHTATPSSRHMPQMTHIAKHGPPKPDGECNPRHMTTHWIDKPWYHNTPTTHTMGTTTTLHGGTPSITFQPTTTPTHHDMPCPPLDNMWPNPYDDYLTYAMAPAAGKTAKMLHGACRDHLLGYTATRPMTSSLTSSIFSIVMKTS